jgi:hypothetical protein
MSWGYFLDLNLTIPTPEWERVAQTKTSDHAIAASWWGFQDKVLGEMFSAPEFDDMTIGEAVALFDRTDSIGKVAVEGDKTTIRLCQLLDRGGEPSIAKSVAALVDATKGSATGTLRLVNDGSYSGEDGVEINATYGALSRTHITGSNELAMKLGSEIYGGEIDEDEIDELFEAATVDPKVHAEGAEAFAAAMGLTDAKAAKKAASKAAASQAATTKPATNKAAAKSPAAKKAAAKSPAAKKPAAKKAAAKKAPAKKAAAKKAGPKKAAAKKAPAKKAPAKKTPAKKPAAKKKRR